MSSRAIRAIQLRGFVVCLMFAAVGFAQDFRSEIQGLVTDPSGLPVPGADVNLLNEDTGRKASTTTNSGGEYRFLKVEPGRYRMEVSKGGFKPWIQRPLVLDIASNVRRDIKLEIGNVQDRIVVSAPAPMVNAVDAAVDQVIRGKEVTDLPINGRNAYALLTLSADVQPNNPGTFSETLPRQRGERSNFSISGSPSQNNEILMDGAPASETGKLVGYPASPDVIREFKVQSNFDAEYGYSLGGVVNTVTKSGTNTFHGSAFEFLRNDVLRANGFFANRNGVGKAPFRFNQFGFAAGGPIIRNKTFFFGSYEVMRQRSPATFIGNMPTEAERQGDFSQTFAANGRQIVIHDPFSTRASGARFVRDAYVGNRIPASRLDPVGKAIVGYYPLPNRPGHPVTGANNYVFNGSSQEDYNTFLIRMDHDINERQRVFGRYIWSHPRGKPFNPYGNEASPNRNSEFNNHLVSTDYTYMYSPTLIFNLRAAYNRFKNTSGPVSVGFDLSTLNLPDSYVRQLRLSYFPRVDVTDSQRLGDVSAGQYSSNNNYALLGNVSKVTGRHFIKVGYDGRFFQLNQFLPGNAAGNFVFTRGFTQGPDPLAPSANAGHGVASLLLGTGSGSTDINEPLSTGQFDWALYINDNFRVTSRFSVSMGLRYDNYSPVNERFDRFNRGFAFDTANPIEAQAQANYSRAPIPQLPVLRATGGLLFSGVDGQPTGLTDRDNNNFSPRLGLTYALTSRTVARAGYGISYKRFEATNQVRQIGFSQNTPWVGSVDGITPLNLASNPYPDGLVQPEGASRRLLTGLGQAITLYETRGRTPVVQSYEASIQHEAFPNVLTEIAYIGNNIQGMIVGHELNALPANYLSLESTLNRRVANPFFGLIEAGTLSTPTTTVSQLLLPYPHFTRFTHQEHIGRSSYHSMRLKVEKRFANGISFLVSYRLSKLMERTDFLNLSDLQLEKSLSSLDSPQRLVMSGIWQLPFGTGRRFASGIRNPFFGKIVSGWQFNWIATFNKGFPVTAPAGAVSTGESAKLDNPTIDRWFNTSVFTLQPPFTLRTLSSVLSDTRWDGVNNFDLSMLKDFRIKESITAQLRFEFFNAFNTPMFGAPVTNIRATTFGQVNSQANSSREIQLALKVLW